MEPLYQKPTNAFTSLGAVPAPPDNVRASASSGGGTGFGRTPDLSGLQPNQLQHLQSVLGNLTYSVPLGGYLFNHEANDPNSDYVKGYYGHPMTGGDPNANREAASIYDLIGQQPTVARGTAALNQLNRNTGATPTQYPSINDTLGPRGPYGGPFTTPLYNPFKI